ncbi:outer membrane lipoprotein-sorting protein [Sinimarinibacterium sp. CAU 1509]|uniref:outer membrane lipoprotein-sorting protein n=1 Tax=Sinimarinibacterium sp. CAU 1509 TaxID=2562283 RepID=UPI00146B124C|nr:outer membrane lipoprotein-sorting protein [Sinimarinibacterium sp. CAU 1509]
MKQTSKTWLRPLLPVALALGAVSAAAHAAPAVQADDSAEAVLECMRANVPTSVRVQQIELEATDRAGAARIVGGRLYARLEPQEDGGRRVRATLRVDSPDYLAGAAYLVREFDAERADGMYVFLPSVKRVRRVSAEFADGALLGTNFSYYDFKQIQNAFGDSSAKLLAPSELQGRAVNVVDFTPSSESASTYTRVHALVDQKTCVPLQIDFIEGDKVHKRWSVEPSALHQSGTHWYAAVSVMRDLQDNTQTLLRVLEVKSDTQVPSRYFEPATFYLGN